MNVAALVDLDAPVTARVVDFSTQYAAARLCGAVVVDESAEIGVGEAVAIHDQYRIASQRTPGKADRACRTERRRLDHCCHFDLAGWGGLLKIFDDRLRPMTQPEHHPPGAKTFQPVEQIGKVGTAQYRGQYFGQVAQHRPNPRSQPACENENVERLQTPSALRNAHAAGCAWDISMSSTILRRSLCRVILSMCFRVSHPNFCVTELRYRFLVKY